MGNRHELTTEKWSGKEKCFIICTNSRSTTGSTVLRKKKLKYNKEAGFGMISTSFSKLYHKQTWAIMWEDTFDFSRASTLSCTAALCQRDVLMFSSCQRSFPLGTPVIAEVLACVCVQPHFCSPSMTWTTPHCLCEALCDAMSVSLLQYTAISSPSLVWP